MGAVKAKAPSEQGLARVHETGRRWALALVAFGVVLYATGPVMIRAASVSGTVFSFWRLLVAVPMLAAPMALLWRGGARRPAKRSWRWALWGGLLFGTHQVMFMVAIKATSVTGVTLMATLGPVVTAALAAPIFGERPGASFRAWTVVAMAGAALVILGGSTGPRGDPVGMGMGFISIVLLASFFIVSKMSRDEIDVVPFLTGSTGTAAIGVGLFALISGERTTALAGDDVVLIVAVAVLGSLGHFATMWPLRWVPANIPALFQLAMPPIAGALAWAFLDEHITGWHWIGGIVTIAGVCGAVLSPSGRGLVAAGKRSAAD